MSTASLNLKSKLSGDFNDTPYSGWSTDFGGGGGDDTYNFNALGGGSRGFEGPSTLVWYGISYFGGWWSSTAQSSLIAYYFRIDSTDLPLEISASSEKFYGYSVRLVRDATTSELLLANGATSDTSSLDSYIGNNGTVYATVKIGTQIWLAQNLRESQFNSGGFSNYVANAGFSPGGLIDDGVWIAYGNDSYSAATIYYDQDKYGPLYESVEPTSIENIYADVLENSLGEDLEWIVSDSNTTNLMYRARFISQREWNQTCIKVTPGYDFSSYSGFIPTLIQKSLIVANSTVGNIDLDFFPITISATGELTIESLNNNIDSLLIGSPDSSVYIEILEYSPPSYYGAGLTVGVGVSNL